MIDPFLAIGGLVFAIFVVLILYHFTHMRPRSRLSPMYAGGERVRPISVPSDNFYLTFKECFPRVYTWLERLHNEDLTDYLFWLAFALLALILGGMLL